jgi:hypothetical protein
MHRRDCVLIAKVLKEAKKDAETETDKAVVDTIIFEFCKALKEEASSFNEKKFRDYIEKGD